MFLFIIPALFIYFVGGFVLCIFLGIFFARKISILLGVFVFAAVFALLYGNEIYVNRQWKSMCEEAGRHVYKQVSADGFFHDSESLSASIAEDYLHRYAYIEGYTSSRGTYVDKVRTLYRYSLDKDGGLLSQKISKPESRYTLRVDSNKKFTAYIYGNEKSIIDLKTGELLGIERRLYTRGGIIMSWLSENFFGHEGSSSSCRKESGGSLLRDVILPETNLEIKS
jgi:hypothetical protein